MKFGRDDIIKRFLASRRTGFYLAVASEGGVGAGDAIVPIGRDPHGVTVTDITELYANKRSDRASLQHALRVEALPEAWRTYFQARIAKTV